MKKKEYMSPVVRELKIMGELMVTGSNGEVQIGIGGEDEDPDGSRAHRRFSDDEDDW